MFWTSCYKQSSVQGLIPYYKKCPEVIRLLVPSLSLWKHHSTLTSRGSWRTVTCNVIYPLFGRWRIVFKGAKSQEPEIVSFWCHTSPQPGLSRSSAAEKPVQTVPLGSSRCSLSCVCRLLGLAWAWSWFGLGLLPASCILWVTPGLLLAAAWMSNRALHVPNKPPRGLCLQLTFIFQQSCVAQSHINKWGGDCTPLPVGGSVESQDMGAGGWGMGNKDTICRVP